MRAYTQPLAVVVDSSHVFLLATPDTPCASKSAHCSFLLQLLSQKGTTSLFLSITALNALNTNIADSAASISSNSTHMHFHALSDLVVRPIRLLSKTGMAFRTLTCNNTKLSVRAALYFTLNEAGYQLLFPYMW